MDYIQATQRFDLDKFINTVKDLDHLEIIKSLNKEIGLAENIKTPSKSEYKRDIEYTQIKYISNLKGLAFLIGQGKKPAGVDNETLNKFRPILLSLIEKNQMDDGILKHIE
jgi:hypothetical protein